MTITTILSLVGISTGIIFVLVIISKLKKAKINKAENKTLKKYQKKIVKTELQKNKVREKHDEVESDIIANPNGDHGVLPVDNSIKHNHGFRDKCASDCPAFDK